MIAVVIGETFGHYFNDWLANRYVASHHGLFEPEARLWTIYLGEILMVPGLIGVGFCLENHAHWGLLAVSWGCYVAGTMLVTTSITAYVLDAYPGASGEVSSWLNLCRTTYVLVRLTILLPILKRAAVGDSSSRMFRSTGPNG